MEILDDADMAIAQLPSHIFSDPKGMESCWKGFDGESVSSRDSVGFSLGNSPRESPRHHVNYHSIDEIM